VGDAHSGGVYSPNSERRCASVKEQFPAFALLGCFHTAWQRGCHRKQNRPTLFCNIAVHYPHIFWRATTSKQFPLEKIFSHLKNNFIIGLWSAHHNTSAQIITTRAKLASLTPPPATFKKT
jgi:hypothetical protein